MCKFIFLSLQNLRLLRLLVPKTRSPVLSVYLCLASIVEGLRGLKSSLSSPHECHNLRWKACDLHFFTTKAVWQALAAFPNNILTLCNTTDNSVYGNVRISIDAPLCFSKETDFIPRAVSPSQNRRNIEFD